MVLRDPVSEGTSIKSPTHYIDASMQGSNSQSTAPVLHGGSKVPRIRFHTVALHSVQLVGAVVSSHDKDLIAQCAHA